MLALMACLFAATYPERVDSLLIWGAQARWVACDDHPWAQTPEEHEAMLAMVQDDWPSIEYITGPGAGMGRDAPPAAVEEQNRLALPQWLRRHRRKNLVPFQHDAPDASANRA